MGYHEKWHLGFIFLLMATYTYAQQDKQFFRKDYTYIEDTKSFYKIHTIGRTFYNALQQCEDEGATLFYPQNECEVKAVINFWKKTAQPIQSVGIGVTSLIVEGYFQTIDGEPITDVYNKWAPGEPNNGAPGEKCVELNINGLLNDVVCTKSPQFICKKTLSSLEWNDACNVPDKDYQLVASTGKCYKFHLEPTDWFDAFRICAAEQSYLAIVNSPEEDKELVKIIAAAPKEDVQGDYLRGAVHMGFLKTSWGWMTIKGQRLKDTGFPNWVGGQPDNAGGNETCGSIFYTGELNDINCDTKLFYICEHDLKKY